MKFVFHSEDSQYDTDTKTWKFTMNERFHNPVELVLDNISFTPSGTTRPNCIYVRSNALSRMIRTRHTVEVKSYQQNSNIIAVLHETHDGRYSMRKARSFPLQPNLSTKIIDFCFTDGNTRLSQGAEAGTTTQQTVNTLEEPLKVMNTNNQMIVWLTMENNCLLDASHMPVAADNFESVIKYVKNRLTDAPQTVMFSTYQYLRRTVLSNTFALAGENFSWNYSMDSSDNPDFPDDAPFVWCCLFRAPSSFQNNYLYRTQRGLQLYLTNGGTMQYTSRNGSSTEWTTLSQITYLPNHEYMITCERKSVGGTWNSFWRLENFTLSTVHTETAQDLRTYEYNSTNYDLVIGYASTGLKCEVGPMVMALLDANDETVAEKQTTDIEAYLKSLYTGEVPTSTESTTSQTQKATFVVDTEIEIS